MTITSKPVITYFAIPFHGRCGAICLLLTDAGIEYEKREVEISNWLVKREELIASGESPHGALPILELDGNTYTHQIPILRMLARRLGKYEGTIAEDIYLADATADLTADFCNAWSISLWGNEAAKAAYHEKQQPRFLASLDRFLALRDGPYILGDEATYADFVVYALLADTHPDISNLPHIKAFWETFSARPAIKSFKNSVA